MNDTPREVTVRIGDELVTYRLPEERVDEPAVMFPNAMIGDRRLKPDDLIAYGYLYQGWTNPEMSPRRVRRSIKRLHAAGYTDENGAPIGNEFYDLEQMYRGGGQ